jgi:hypothetical protein
MRTALIVLGGFVLWGVCVGIAKAAENLQRELGDSGDRSFCRGLVGSGGGKYVDGSRQGGLFVRGGIAYFSDDLSVANDAGGDRKLEVSLKISGGFLKRARV